jgi:hypothetical protein
MTVALESDKFSIQLLEEAKRFLERADDSDTPDAFLHAALLLGFSSLESHLNGVADELKLRKDTTLPDQAVLSLDLSSSTVDHVLCRFLVRRWVIVPSGCDGLTDAFGWSPVPRAGCWVVGAVGVCSTGRWDRAECGDHVGQQGCPGGVCR